MHRRETNMRMRKRLKGILGHTLLNLFMIAACFLALLPVLYALSVSLSAGNSLLSASFSLIPRAVTLQHYGAVFTQQPMLVWFANSAILAICTVAISLAVAVPAAYVFSRRRFPGRLAVLRILLLLYSFPQVLSMLALYKLLSPLGLVDSRAGLTFIYTGTMAVFGLWNMKGYFDTIPIEIEEAARMDGCDDMRLVMRIVLPLARPSVIVTAAMVLVFVWNEYLFAVTFLTGEANYTLAGGLYTMQATEMSGSWPVFAAASLLISLPILIIFFLAQRHMVSGLTAGGVKG